MEPVKIFSKDFEKLLISSVKFLQLSTKEEQTSEPTKWTGSGTNLSCSYCHVEFPNGVQQRQHYKLDWHRYNVKQSLLVRQPVTEDEFNEKSDDISSISGSDSESEDNLENIARAEGKLFLKNAEEKVFSLYRCLLFEKKAEIETFDLQKLLQDCSSNSQWTVLMLGGGHFAGAVFQGDTPILHKTFHCYTVRAGQGGSQGARDNRSGGSQPKSAGASLRRYNEGALVQVPGMIDECIKLEIVKLTLKIFLNDIRPAATVRWIHPLLRDVCCESRSYEFLKEQFLPNTLDILRNAVTHVREILEVWKSEIAASSLVVYRATGPHNRSVLFGGKTFPLNRLDSRLRSIPFSTRRATFTELKRVHTSLSTAYVYESLEAALQQLPKLEENVNKKCKATNVDRSKSRERIERSQPAPSSSSSSSSGDESDLEDNLADLSTNVLEIYFQESLQCYDDTLTPEERQRKPRKHKKPKKSKNKRLKEKEIERKKEICATIKAGDLERLELLIKEGATAVELSKVEPTEEVDKVIEEQTELNLLNEVIDDLGNSWLHVAAINQKVEVVKFLLDHEADPCSRNEKLQTPYTCTQSKEVRNVFKEFAQEFPDKYNYNKAQIPTTKLTPEELLEKKNAQKKVKREKEKERRKVNAVKKQEDHDKERFINLSDREKRALAAERRILNQSGTVVARCFLCAIDISGRVPFEYSGNRFCSIECLKAHRLKTTTVLS